MTIAELHHVNFTYDGQDHPALQDVNLRLEPGLLYGVVGANASGKSTLCSLVRGLIPNFHSGDLTGDVHVLGKPLTTWDSSELSTKIGYVFQNPFTQISGVKETVFEEIALGLENLGQPVDTIIATVERIVDLVGIGHLIGKNPNELSGGQRQKVAFASVLAMDADVIVIDEPTSQLDPESSDAIFRIIGDLRTQGKTILLVEHKIDLLATFADRIIVMEDGTVHAEGPTRDIFTSPQLEQWSVPRPEITRLALLLEGEGVTFPELPLVRAEAQTALAERSTRR